MKQFLLLLGVAAVAGAMYVAGASGSQQAKFASQKEVAALQKKVTVLTSELKKTVKPEADLSASYILTCLAQVSGGSVTVHTLSALQRGSTTSGYLFGSTAATSAPTTALDIAPQGTTPTAVLQEFDPSCLGGALKQSAVGSSLSRLHLQMAKNTR